MAITNLTGTRWIFNNSLSLTTTKVWNVEYNIYGGGMFTKLGFNTNGSTTKSQTLFYISSTTSYYIYTNGSWGSEDPNTIEFSGGSDATNATLIAWMEANAQFIGGITDVTGTQWILQSRLDEGEDYSLEAYINFISKGVLSYRATYSYLYRVCARYSGISTQSDYLQYSTGSGRETVYDYEWADDRYKNLIITGGSDATDVDLVNWLKTYGTVYINNTVWTFNSTPSAPDTGFWWNVSFKDANNTTWTNIDLRMTGDIYFGSTLVYNATTETWADEAYKTIRIFNFTEGGDDPIDTIIPWLQTRATFTDVWGLAPNIPVKVNGSWVDSVASAKVNDAWVEVTSAYIKQNNIWTEIS